MNKDGELEFEFEFWKQVLILNGQTARNADLLSEKLAELVDLKRDPLVIAFVGDCLEILQNMLDSAEAIAHVVGGRITYHEANPDQ